MVIIIQYFKLECLLSSNVFEILAENIFVVHVYTMHQLKLDVSSCECYRWKDELLLYYVSVGICETSRNYLMQFLRLVEVD